MKQTIEIEVPDGKKAVWKDNKVVFEDIKPSNFGGIHIDNCIDWLEKQGEDKKEINNFDVLPGLYKCIHRMFDGTPDGRLLFEIGNVYKCLSKHNRAEFEVSYGHSVYLEDPVVCKYFIPFESKDEQASSQTNERAWLYLVSDVLTWKNGIGQYLDDPRVQELAKRLCSEYAQKLYNSSILSNYSNNGKNEQTPADNVEPRFKVGDWLCANELNDYANLIKIVKIVDVFGKKRYKISRDYDSDLDLTEFDFIEKHYHLWTIQDAKDGDILCCKSGWMCIFKSLNDHTNTFSSYCFMDSDKCFFNSGSECHTLDKEFINAYNGLIHPATKEQRDFLFKKLKESGYKWNAGTKTLEKLVEPKFNVGDKIVNLPMKYMGGSWTQGTISKITDDKYIFTDGSYIYISNQDSWKLVHDKKSKFDPKTLQPYDKVLVRRGNENFYVWFPDFVADPPNNDNNKTLCMCVGDDIAMVIPYNNDTKHLIGTTNEAPEHYRYWED